MGELDEGIFSPHPPARSRVFDPMEELQLRAVLDNLVNGCEYNRATLVEVRDTVVRLLKLLDTVCSAQTCAEADRSTVAAAARHLLAKLGTVRAPGAAYALRDALEATGG